MIKKLKYIKLFWQLCKTDIIVFRQYVIENIINIIIWVSSFLILGTYIFPALGMTQKWGEFIAFSLVVGESYWRIWSSSSDLLSDLEGNKTISYYFSLPLPSWLILLKLVVLHAFKALVYCLVIIPLIALLLWNRISWSAFSVPKFMLIFVIISLFTGSLFILLTSFTPRMKSIDKVGIRILFPLWIFGAAEFPWQTLNAAGYSKLSAISLANPVVYAMEGIHAAALGQEGFLPFWLCAAVLSVVSALFCTIGILKFKKRLDII